MQGLPQLIIEIPRHTWEPSAQMFVARIFARDHVGELVCTTTYAISPHVFAAIRQDHAEAWAAFEDWKAGEQSKVVKLR